MKALPLLAAIALSSCGGLPDELEVDRRFGTPGVDPLATAIAAAADAWNATENAYVELRFGRDVSYRHGRRTLRMVEDDEDRRFFADARSTPFALATTERAVSLSSLASGFELDRETMYVDPGMVLWTASDEDLVAAGMSPIVVFYDTVLHELGHHFGLEHVGAPSATMFGETSPTASHCITPEDAGELCRATGGCKRRLKGVCSDVGHVSQELGSTPEVPARLSTAHRQVD